MACFLARAPIAAINRVSNRGPRPECHLERSREIPKVFLVEGRVTWERISASCEIKGTVNS